MLKILRVIALGATCLMSGAALISSEALAQQYPNKPVKIVIPFPAGGVTDLAGRLIAQKLSERLGQQFFIEKIGGARGQLRLGQGARLPGGGHTALLSWPGGPGEPRLFTQKPLDVGKDIYPPT